MLLDTNIVIYAAKGQHPEVRKLLKGHDPVVSVVTYVEALGFSRIEAQEKAELEASFESGRCFGLPGR